MAIKKYLLYDGDIFKGYCDKEMYKYYVKHRNSNIEYRKEKIDIRLLMGYEIVKYYDFSDMELILNRKEIISMESTINLYIRLTGEVVDDINDNLDFIKDTTTVVLILKGLTKVNKKLQRVLTKSNYIHEELDVYKILDEFIK